MNPEGEVNFQAPASEQTPEEKFLESLKDLPIDHLKGLEVGMTHLRAIAELNPEQTAQVLGMREVSKDQLDKRLEEIKAAIAQKEGNQ